MRFSSDQKESLTPTYSNSWLNNQKVILLALTLSGSLVVILWQLLDTFFVGEGNERINMLRWITVLVYMSNLLIAFLRRTPQAVKQHLVAGFYFGAVFCTLVTMFTGASVSPYWFSLFFIIIAWFVLIPYNFREMTLHSLVFVGMFVAGQYAQREFQVVPFEMGRIIFLYSGTLMVSFFAAYTRNRMDNENSRFREELKEKNFELNAINSKLTSEISKHHETNQKLLEKQQFLDGILVNAPIVIWSIDTQGVFTYSQFRGREDASENINRIGKSAFEVYRDTPVEKFIRDIIESGNPRNEIIHLDKIYYDTRVSAIYGPDGVKTGYMGVSMDISERIRKERDLKKFRTVLDQAPGAVFIMDKDARFEYMNPMFTRLSGYSEEDLLHHSIFDTLYKGRNIESRAGIIDTIRSGKSWQGELQTLNKNGSAYWVNTTAAPYRDEKGEIDGYIVIQQDITEKKKMEYALRESESKYRTLIEKAIDGIIITQHGKLKFVNSAFCAIIQYSAEELADRDYLDFVVPEDHDMMINFHKRRMKGEQFQVIYQSRIIRKDGSILPVELNTATSDYNGQPAAFIIVRDISERINNERDLQIAKEKLESLNRTLEHRVLESTLKLTEANTQLIRLQKENLQSQFEVLRQQVNPHFLFNSLNVLTSLIKLEPDLAEKFTEHLSKVYRYVLENKENDLVELSTELEFLDAYIFLLEIRFVGKIDIRIKIDNEKKRMLILPLSLQLLIENAIKHNSMSKKTPLMIQIFIDEGDILNVINNLQERETHLASTGVGLRNIEHRYRILEKPLPDFYKTETQFIAKIPLIAGKN